MKPRNTILREADTTPTSSSSSPNPSSLKSKSLRKQKAFKENNPPPDQASVNSDHKPSPAAVKMKSPLPPRPPPSNPLKRKLSMDTVPENVITGSSDSGVKVIVRIRPPKDEEEGETIAKRISSDSLSINGQTFTFDSVADTDATQQDIFQLVGASLVENCLAGFNSSVFAYGQTGSGKTYTMWGPTNALLEENLGSDQQGLTPRVFQRLFARINEEQIKHGGKQLNYQCRCSFLEIYNEQVTDLLDPSQKNLQIREDVKSGVYVENLTEEYVCTTKDVTQLLIKGLSNRRTGSTSINAESSRSHSVFTCFVESRCKSVADGISSLKTSRINLVDLAGSERQKLTGAAGERLKEAGNINRSLSQLGNLINILAEVSQTGKQRHIPYRDSRLTFLLQESLGGNAKLAMVCAVSPAQSETFSTLRFAQRAKAIKNKAIVNEVMQEDVKYLREVIRQLKEELHRMKENGNNHPTESKGGYSTEWARRSLNLLKLSLNRPMMLSHIDDDEDVEMEIDEEAVEKLCIQAGLQSDSNEDHGTLVESVCATEHVCEDIDVKMEEGISEDIEKDEKMIIDCDKPVTGISCTYNTTGLVHQNVTEKEKENLVHLSVDTLGRQCSGQSTEEKKITSSAVARLSKDESPTKMVGSGSSCQVFDPQSRISAGITEDVVSDSHRDSVNCVSPPLSVGPSDVSPVFKSPTLSVSPRLSNSRKSLRTSWALTASQKDLKDGKILGPENLQLSSLKSLKGKSMAALSAQDNKHFTPTDNLAASLHRGLEIIDSHQQSLVLRPSSFRFSFKPTETKLIFPVDKVNVAVQTLPEDDVQTKEDTLVFLCSNCNSKTKLEEKGANESSDLQLVPVDGSESIGKLKKQVPKAVEKVLAGAIRREMAVEEFCAKQTAEIVQLNRLVQQYKHERECNAIIGQTREDKIIRLESLMDGILPTEEFMEEELVSLTHEHKLLKEKYENHPEILRTKIELELAQNELERYRNFYELGEREVLLEEIQDLRHQLQFYIDSSSSTRNRNSILQLTYSCGPTSAPFLGEIPESTNESAEGTLEQERESAEGTLEQERIHWTEAESKWISLVEELRLDLEASRSLAEKQKQELETEKKCAEELQEAMRMAMQGHARMLEQYADLEEKHIQLLARHRKMQEGIDDVKKAAARAGVRGAESRFINTLAAEISALKVDREKERRYLRDENKALQAQLRDTAEAVQAAGELLVRLKEAEEAVTVAQTQALEAKEETEKAYKQIKRLNRKHEHEISTLNGLLAESRLPKEAIQTAYNDSEMAAFDAQKPTSTGDQQWKEEFEHFYNGEDGEFSKLPEASSWFSGYDRCNI
ncbi:kinesin-like protein KIN-12B isoform X2 [Tripterygium wilfordii]|uniref:kinesin-like protein KIN-12B isoform X2 n=1 Tax=Tripterygium wilfordii TaxID=458696 RepID=UPI0018F83A97|nr:kinesin-like protein KIN-12B isoform X2 [Tripterygium wilfordii]